MNDSASYIAEAASEYLVKSIHDRLLDELANTDDYEYANERLHQLAHIRDFFSGSQPLNEFLRALSAPSAIPNTVRQREWGDFQTPPLLAKRVCEFLASTGLAPRIIIEPTYGAGNFIVAALNTFPKAKLVYGVEIQEKYAWQLKMGLLAQALSGYRPSAEIVLRQDDIFTHVFPDSLLETDGILIIGNPPWITSAELSALDASNLPRKRNLKGLSGLDAITGKGNFDIGEFILLRMLELFSKRRGTLAVLCKNSVIKNIVEALPQSRFLVDHIRSYTINAKLEFGAAVDASLFVMDMGRSDPSISCTVADFDHPDQSTRVFGWTQGRFVADIRSYEQVSRIDGRSPLMWRQGLKHDCARIMELDARNGKLLNGNGENVDIEESSVYWLLKGSDLKAFEVDQARKKVVVTQRFVGDDTSRLKTNAPRLWNYLIKNSAYFDKRKSSVYRNRPRFAIFGIGEYSFKPYKVAISGLHKHPRFSLVLPIDSRPVMLDDTCYFLGFESYAESLLTVSLLNSALVKRFLGSAVFTDAKRPYTKTILMRIDLCEAARQLTLDALRAVWSHAGYQPQHPVSESDYQAYRQRLFSIHAERADFQPRLNL